MFILHVVTNYYPVIGGLERAVQGLAEAQARLGHEVHVITSAYGAEHRPVTEILGGVCIHRVKAWRLHYPDLTVPREIPLNLLKMSDVVHIHSQNSLFNMRILSESFKLGTRSACHFMAVESFKNHPNMIVRLLGPYHGRINTKRALDMVDLILVRSLKDLKTLKRVYGVDAAYLPDAVPDHYLTFKKGDPEEFRERFRIRQEKIFLFVGRIHKLKGPHILVKALKYVRDEDVAVVFIGPDGGYLTETMEMAKRIGVRDRVYVLGVVDEMTKIHALDSSIALVLPSIADFEVYPMVVSEAWAREKPVIGSNVGGIPYRVIHGLNGLLVEPSRPEALAEAIMKLANDEELATKLGKQGRIDVLTWDNVALRSIELYQQAVAVRDSARTYQVK